MTTFPKALSRVPRVPKTVDRPRLSRLLEADETALVLVGPAGSGKTVLAAQLVAGLPRAGWCRLTPAYGRAEDLVGIAATSLGVAEIPSANRGLLDMASQLVDLLEPDPTIVVVDDYHLADGDECDPLLAEAIPLVPPESKLVICTHTRPPGLIGRVAGGGLRIVNADELAFTTDEAEAFFTSAGRDAAVARDACESLGGWPAGVASVVESGSAGTDDPLLAVVRRVLPVDGDDARRTAVEALAVLPYVTPELAAGLGLEPSAPAQIADETSLVVEESGSWRAHQVVRDALVALIPDDRVRELQQRAAALLSDVDPPVAIDLFLEGADPDAAAGVLGDHLSEIGVERALHWLYRLPPELRHAFPPVLAAGKATVDIDAAIAAAELRVEKAADDASRREALFALGSAQAHAGSLSAAASALEQASGPGAPEALQRRASAWLGVVRWWAGDLVGARAALASTHGDTIGAWALAETALADGALEEAEELAREGVRLSREASGEGDLSDAACRSVQARVALLKGDRVVGRGQARGAYQLGAEQGGFDLSAAAPAHAWVLVDDGDIDGASAVADVLERRMARHDAFAKVHVALIRLAVAHAQGDVSGIDKAQRRLAQLRQLGFAPIEAQARTMVAALGGRDVSGLEVLVLGPAATRVGGEDVAARSWKSRKALEVLWYLALAGERGAQREEVIEAVWPEREPDKGRMLLRAALAEIRRRLEPGRPAGEPSQFLHSTGDRVRLDAVTDVTEARRLSAEGQSGEALALFRGELLEEDPYLDWAFDERRTAETLRLELAERVAGDSAADTADRVAALELLIAAEPWREALYDRLAAVHRDAGNEAGARSAERRRDADE